VASPRTRAVVRSTVLPLFLTALACADLTGPLPYDPALRTNTLPGSAHVYFMVQTDPDGATATFSFEHDFGANSAPVVPTPFVLSDGQLKAFNYVAAGTYTVTQTAPADWELVASGDGEISECYDSSGGSTLDLASGVASIDVGPGDFIICTFVNAPRTTPPDDPPPENTEPDPPTGEPQGAGAWKKGLSCSEGDPALLSHPAVVPFGTLASLDCAQAARLLAKQDFSGTQKASDGAYNLASPLLTARLNRAAGAAVPACVGDALAEAQTLLANVGFNGLGDYLGPRGADKAGRNAALSLAELLASYNDGDPSVLAGDCG
jgi:hypothetical protein